MTLKDDQIRSLLEASAATRDVEIDCDEFFAVMPEVAEAHAAGRALPPALHLAGEHEQRCPTCREECAALVEAIAPGAGGHAGGGDPAPGAGGHASSGDPRPGGGS